MAPSDFYPFPKLKSNHRGTQYGSNDGRRSKRVIGGTGTAFFLEGIRKLSQRLVKCIALKGDYIEKKWSDFHSLVAEVQMAENFLIISCTRLRYLNQYNRVFCCYFWFGLYTPPSQ